ncbi:phage portal protein [Kitasatospora sp. NPDC001683]
MGIRDRISKVFGSGNQVPAQIVAAEQAAQMTPQSPFSPGTPQLPFDGYSRQPRARDFQTGVNIASRPRLHERVSFPTLRGLIEAYDVAQTCIWHRIDSIRALDWSLTPMPGFHGDATAAIAQGMVVLEKPDRQTPFANWLAKWLYDVLAYDAGALYRMRNRRGDAIGLMVVDGTTIAPLLDYWGNVPTEAEAYVQYVQGLPWNWLTRNDLIYEPFRPRANSPYGTAPLESILLNANTDLRFQAHFLQRFTEGNVPEAFASAPETWTPDQIEEWQVAWDALMMGDQAAKHQIKWMPGGSGITWSNEKDFSDTFSLFLMRKTCAAYHVVPSDLGFTETVNLSSSESQGDVQHRVGDLPLIAHIQSVLSSFLRDDLGLPVCFSFDTGQEKEDRLVLAQAWQVYIETGMASADEGREALLGLPADPTRPTPRFFSTPRVGPIPLLAIDGIAGKVDPETYGPAKDQRILDQPFVPPPGTVPAPGTTDQAASAAAEDAYQAQYNKLVHASDVAKDAEAGSPAAEPTAPTAGITSATGITGYDLVRTGEDEEEDDRAQLAKQELAAFHRFARARRRDGRWRDFAFQHVVPSRARRLNQSGRLAVRKTAGEVAVAGLAVQAVDTGRVLMIQRALDPDDPAAGMWEFPGGHLEGAETPLQGAWREWAEETGCIPPPGSSAGSWISADGIYQGLVWAVDSEDMVPVASGRDRVDNPDDPDGDQVEAIAWWDPALLAGNPAVRPELLAGLSDVLAVLGQDEQADVAKAGDVGPKVLTGQVGSRMIAPPATGHR